MKKFLAFLFTIALMIACISVTSFAADDRKQITSLYFTVNTAEIVPGTEPDELDAGFVDVKWVDQNGDKAANKFYVTVSDLQCQNSNNYFKVGDTVKFKFYADIHNLGGTTYYVSSSTTVHVANVDGNTSPKVKSVSKKRDGDGTMVITVNTSGIKGELTEPDDLRWDNSQLGLARWTAPENGNTEGYYEVKLMRDDKTVTSFKDYNATSINLYPWMTKEGDYSFAVRTVPTSGSSGAKKSEWQDSECLDIPANKVSDGSGQNASGGSSSSGGNSGGQVGWRQVNGTWYFYYPDGSMKKNGWEKVSNKWYYFDATGAMQKGWKTVGANTYYLDSNNGDMKSGWVKTSDGQWYYLNSTENDSNYGAMLKNQWLDYKNNRYYLKDSGAMATGWLKIGDAYYHFNSDGALSVSTTIDGFKVDSNGRWLQGQ